MSDILTIERVAELKKYAEEHAAGRRDQPPERYAKPDEILTLCNAWLELRNQSDAGHE